MSQTKTFVRNYDLAAAAPASFIYLATGDAERGPYGARVKTVGSSTTITAVSATRRPFSGLLPGDELIFKVAGVISRRLIVTANPNGQSVTVNSAINLENSGAGYTFSYRTIRGGTADTDGWHNVKFWTNKVVKIEALLFTGTDTIDYSIEGRLTGDAGDVPLRLLSGSLVGATFPDDGAFIPIMEGVSSVRVGLRWSAADGAGPDSVSAYIMGESK